MLSDITKALIVFAVIIVIYFIYITYSNKDINRLPTEKFLGKIRKYIPEPFTELAKDNATSVSGSQTLSPDATTAKTQNNSSVSTDSSTVSESKPVAQEAKKVDLIDKMATKNTSFDGNKRVNYADGTRGNYGNSEWTQYFDQVSDLTNNLDQYKNDNFKPNEAPLNAQAMQRLFNKKGLEKPEDLFDVDKFLPKDVRDDWFEVMPEPISVKNRHLINITRPIGVNTISSSLRNPSHDLRGAQPNPKFVVSPWNQSTIEPDINIKPIL